MLNTLSLFGFFVVAVVLFVCFEVYGLDQGDYVIIHAMVIFNVNVIINTHTSINETTNSSYAQLSKIQNTIKRSSFREDLELEPGTVQGTKMKAKKQRLRQKTAHLSE